MIEAIRSEFFLMKRRSVGYIIGALWVLMIVLFAYGIPFIVAVTLPNPADSANLFHVLSVPEFPSTAVGSYPMFGGAMFLILGASIMGAEFSWSTWKVRFTQGPSRSEVMLAKFVAGALTAFFAVTAAHALALVTSFIMSSVSDVSTTLPSTGALLKSWGIALVISVASCWLGMALTVLTKNLALALTIGLLWTLAFENIVAGLAAMWPSLAFIQKILLGPAGGSLAYSLGAAPMMQGGTPGVVDAHSVPSALLVLAIYCALSILVSVGVMRRRDIA